MQRNAKLFFVRSVDRESIEFLKKECKKSAIVFGPGAVNYKSIDHDDACSIAELLGTELKVPTMMLKESMGDDSMLAKYHFPLWEFLSKTAVWEGFERVIVVIPESHAAIIHKGSEHFRKLLIHTDSSLEWELFPEDPMVAVVELDLSTNPVVPLQLSAGRKLIRIHKQTG